MASVQLTQIQQNLLQDVCEQNKIKNYTVDIALNSMKGDGYLGIILTVTVKDKQSSKTLDLIIKTAQTGQELRKQAPIALAYQREVFLYKTIFPAFHTFQLEAGDIVFSSYAKCYATCLTEGNECLILENLKVQGYKLWNRFVPMNPDHLALVLKEYGKYHAVSLAFKKQRPEEFKQFAVQMPNYFRETLPPEQAKLMVQQQIKLISDNLKDKELKKPFENYGSNIMEFLMVKMVKEDDSFVILHGDCWCNNMMFFYNEGEAKPNKMKLLDWQISYYGSLICDLAYFFCTCSGKEQLKDHKKFLKIYYDSLAESLRKMGCDPDQIYSQEVFLQDWKEKVKFGLHLSMMVLKIVLSAPEEAPDLKELAEEGKNLIDALNVDIQKSDYYYERIENLISFMNENNYLSF